jgi:hypothetical protein
MTTQRFLLGAAIACAGAALACGKPIPTKRVCYPTPPYDANCLEWEDDGTNITFTASWPFVTGTSAPAQWGGWGISELTCGSMFPASMWFVVRNPNGVTIEDRYSVSHQVPQCRKTQLSHITRYHVSEDGSLNVTWTRPLAPPPSSGQPTIVAGNVTLIGAVFAGPPLDLRPCESTGVPAHGPFMSATVQLVADPGEPSSAAAAVVTPVAGLVASFPVCAGTYVPYSNLARVTATGIEKFYGVSSPLTLYAGSTVDPVGRQLYTLELSSNAQSYLLASLNVDTGALGASCDTGIPVPSTNQLTNLAIAWDSNTATVIIAGCTDIECAGYVQVARLDPDTCTVKPVVKVPTDPAANVVQSAAAFDPITNTFVMTLTQARGKAAAAPVLIAVDMLAGNVTHTVGETGRNVTIVSLVNAGSGRFYGLNSSTPYSYTAGVSLVTYDSTRNTLRAAALVPDILSAVPSLAALARAGPGEGDVYYFVNLVQTGAQLVGLFASNGTVASIGSFPGDTSQAPSALFHV